MKPARFHGRGSGSEAGGQLGRASAHPGDLLTRPRHADVRHHQPWIHPHEVLLEAEFTVVVSGTEGWYTVTLTPKELVLSGRGRGCLARHTRTAFQGRDILTVRPGGQEKKKQKNSRCPVFMVVVYPVTKGKRERRALYFYMKPSTTTSSRREDVVHCTRLWVGAVSTVFLGRDPESLLLVAQPPFLVLVNPFSGRGQSRQLWAKVAGILQEAGHTWELLITQGPEHARDIMSKVQLSDWRGVLVVSGDGLVHEVYNGLFARADWRTALEFPVGVIPAGSGNALSTSLLHIQGEAPEDDRGVTSAAVSVARANLCPIDLMVLRTETETRVAFLSLGWGLITDVDFDSEGLRTLGSIRFYLYFVLKVAKRRLYRGTVSYVLADWPRQSTIQVPIHGETDSDWTSSSQDMNSLLPPYRLYPHHLIIPPYSPPLPPPSLTYAQSWQELDERLCSVSFLASHEDAYHYHHHPQSNHRPPSEFRAASEKRGAPPPSREADRRAVSEHRYRSKHRSGSECNGGGSRKASCTPVGHPASCAPVGHPASPTPTGLPPAAPAPVFPRKISDSMDPALHPLIATPLHKDWVTETSDYLCVYVLNLPYIDRQTCLAPDCMPGDGVMWLLLVRGSCTRSDLFKMMLELDNGNPADVPGVDLFPVSAVKIQPQLPAHPIADSFMSVDGERMPAEAVQVHLLPGAGRVFVK